jgi:hypothetical protein
MVILFYVVHGYQNPVGRMSVIKNPGNVKVLFAKC